MLKFSACRAHRDDKKYYKGFHQEREEMANMGHYLRKYALSSYLYGNGYTETEPAEYCEGHKAWKSVVGAGNVLLFDFDSKVVPVTFEMLVDKFRGVSSYIAPSKSWSKELEKYHVVVELSEALPVDKHQFTRIYRAAAQHFGVAGLYDPAMESATQNMAPHGLNDALEMYIEGAPLEVAAILDGFVPVESGRSDKQLVGEVPFDAVFTLSQSRQQVSVDELVSIVRTRGKQRVYCLDGVEHGGGGGIDSAFVAEQSDGSLLYCCEGGSCKHTRYIAVNPFQQLAEVTEVTEVTETLADIINAHAGVNFVYTLDKPKEWQVEAAVNYGLNYRREELDVCRVEGKIRRYTGVYWEEIFGDKAQMYEYVKNAIQEAGFFTLSYKNAFLNSGFNYFKNLIPAKELEKHGNYLNMNNCVLEVSGSGIRALPHSPDYLFTSVLPYDYDPEATAPVWDMVVDRVMCGDKDTKEALQQALGYLLLREFNLEKMVCFVGEGENGKSTIFKVLKKLVGRSGYSAQPIKTLLNNGSEGGYARSQLAGKLVNITNELTPSTLQADAFKDLISGEDIIARNIYEAPFVLATVPKQIVAMNTTDSLIKEKTHGFMRRLLLIPFNYRLKEEHKDAKLEEKLDAELSGILNWILKGAEAVMANNGIKESLAMRRLFENVKRDANPTQQFAEECLEVYTEADMDYDSEVLSGSQIYEHYLTFVEVNHYQKIGRNKFLAELEGVGVPRVDTTRNKEGRPARKIKGFLCSLRTAQGSSSRVKAGFTPL